ncbi:MAG: TonB-dependent receptor [Acidobacteriota bacterium]|nr:TonB-dependent receptor [Acidobacteriota bacterium]
MSRKVILLLAIFLKAAFSQVASPPPAQPPVAQAAPVQTESMIVTGTFLPVPLSESDRSVVSLDTREHSLLFTYGVEYLELDPSVDLQQRAPAGVQADLTILGSTFAETLVLLNGLRLNDAQSAHHDLDIPVPLEAVSRIEVLHGTGSTTYGADATAGAVNFITSPVRATELRVRLGVGNYGYNQEHVLAAFLIKNWSETIAADRDFSTGFRRDRDFRSSAASSETRFRSRLGDTDFLFAGSDRPFGADQFYGNFPSWERTKNRYASVQQDLGTKTTAAFAYRRHTDEFVLIRNQPTIYENNHIDGSWQATLRRHQSLRDNSTFSYGAEGQGDTIESNNLGQHARNREAVYANLDFRYLRRFSFSAGGREELFSGGNHVFTPTIAGGWWLKPAFKLRASVSRGFRAPTYTDLYYSDPTTVGNASLKPEASWGVEAGGDWNPSERITAGATFFQRRDSNVIDYVRFASGQRFQATNIQRLHFNGVEAHLGLRLHHEQQIQLAYTFLHGDEGLVPGAVSRYVYNYPSNKAVFSWTGSLREWLVARTRVGITQRVGHDAYPVWDVAIAAKRGWVRPYVQMTNLSNTGYVEIPNVVMPSRTLVGGVELALARKSH